MALEGELRVGLRVGDGHIDRVRVASTRPDVARTLLQSRTRAEVSAAVPLLFSICGRSQSAANELACAAACDEALPGALSRCAGAVAAETVRECAWRTLLDWPRWIGEQPADDAVAAARLSLAFRCQEAAAPDAQAIAVAAFGMSGEEWLGLQS